MSDALNLTPNQRAAMEAAVADGIFGFIQRIRANHGPRFGHTTYVSDRYPGGVVFAGCRCDTVGCSYPYFLLHISDLISAYESKVQDFAQETTRHGAALAECSRLRAQLEAK